MNHARNLLTYCHKMTLDKLAFIILSVLWSLLFFYTFEPYLTGQSLSVSNLDLSFITTLLVGISVTSSSIWLCVFVIFHFVVDKTISQQRSLVARAIQGRGNASSISINALVSIIIPARNEESVIQETIRNCLKQSYDNIEVLVVCHNSSDATFEIASNVHDHRVKIFNLETKEAGKGIALNYVIDKASGDFLLILDSDGRLDKHFIEYTLPYFKEGYTAVQGKILPSNRSYSLLTHLLALEGDLYSVPFMTVRSFLQKRTPLGGTGFIIRRDKLLQIGKFSNSLIDDFELSFRLYRNSCTVAFAPLSLVYDEKPPVFGLMIRQRQRWVKGHIDLLMHKVSEPKDVLGIFYWLSPVFSMAGLLSLMVASYAVISYLLFGHYPYKFAFIPFVIWFIMLITTSALGLSILRYGNDTRNFKSILHSLLLAPFSNYWYIVLVKAFFVKSWANTKTPHGFQVSQP